MAELASDGPRRLTLRHPRGVSEILVGHGLLGAGGGGALDDVANWCRGRVVFLVTSEVPERHCGDAARDLLEPATRLETIEIPDGEAAKTLECAGSVWRQMLERGGKRDSRLVTLGGGAVGDLGGFAAAAFLRGIDYVQIPTTLLAQVDASVGGKTAVDLPGGKNTVGAFHHPRFVLADVDCLRTLPRGELRAGLFEVVKMAALLDLDLLATVEESLDRLLAVDADVLTPVVAASIAAKLGVVEADLEEGDRRRLLNFGHTLAHAIESEFGYRELRHGDAVGHGMRFALRLALRRGLDPEFAARLDRMIDRLGPPHLGAVEERRGIRLDVDRLIAAMGRDKKARESGLVWILPAAPGRGEIVVDLDPAFVRRELRAFLDDSRGRPLGSAR
ncbi:MAG: 3-dehydroquinate synthase [Acidobacteria bacterium]|nr:3-dehydroquinate synthase [Acidobacteriota bacterium]